jgi:hypothetical protein
MTTLIDKINEYNSFFGHYFEDILQGKIKSLSQKQEEEFKKNITALFELMESQASKKNIIKITRSIVEEFESYDCGIELSLKKDFRKYRRGTTTVYEYKGEDKIGLRKIETRVKSVYSLFKKMIIARLFDKRISDIIGGLYIRDDPTTLKVDFERIYKNKDKEYLIEIIKRDIYVQNEIIKTDLFNEDFDRLFSEFKNKYQAIFEKRNILAIEELGEFLQNENQQISPRWRVVYVAPRHFVFQNFDMDMTIQDYKHSNSLRNLRNITGYWHQRNGAKKLIEQKKKELKSKKKISKYQEIRCGQWDDCFLYESNETIEILAKKNDVTLNFLGKKDNPWFINDSLEFINRIFSRYESRGQEADLYAQGIIASDKNWPSENRLSSINFKLSPFEIPRGWLEDVIEINSELIRNLREKGFYHNPSRDPHLFCRNWVKSPKKNNFRALIYRLEDFIEVQLRTSFMHFINESGDAAHDKEYKDRIDEEIEKFLRKSIAAKESGFSQENTKAFFALLDFSQEVIKQEYINKANFYANQIASSKKPIYFLNRLLNLYESFKSDRYKANKKDIEEILERMIPEKGHRIIENLRLLESVEYYLKQDGVIVDMQEIKERSHLNYLNELICWCRKYSTKKDHISKAISLGLVPLILNYESVYKVTLSRKGEINYDFGRNISFDDKGRIYHNFKVKLTDNLMRAIDRRLKENGFDEFTNREIQINIQKIYKDTSY